MIGTAMKRSGAPTALVVALFLMLSAASLSAEPLVYLIPIHKTIEGGLAAFVERAIREAEEAGADAIIFDVNTPGGRVDAAIVAEHIVMAGGSTIGAATPVDLQGEKASEKYVSYFRAEMKATAEKRGRPVRLAEAMVDEDVGIPGLCPKGKLLTLTAEEALQHGMADHTANTVNEVLALYGLSGATVTSPRVNWAERIVRFLTDPIVSSMLITLGFLGLLFELRTPGWGVGGSIGLIALTLFFGGHLIVHLANWSELLLFGTGVVLLLIELLYIPGFGVVGVLGIGLMVTGLVLSFVGRFPSGQEILGALRLLGLSVITTIVASILILRSLPKRAFWGRILLQTAETTQEGFRASPAEPESMIGATGTALTLLRPAGTGIFGDHRLPVVTEGGYVPKGTAIKIVAVEGNRIVVRET
jgi:membrane-bound serine protease (ClpP class)